ncbi:MAG: glycosyltransferase [bacterium]|nr:glycosyltransferase [bacterium]
MAHKIKKILIVPIAVIVEEKTGLSGGAFFNEWLLKVKRGVLGQTTVYNGELEFYADMPMLLGKENVFIFGRYFPHFYEKEVPPDSAYPSCHGTPRPTTLSESEVRGVIKDVDVVLVSTRAGKNGILAIELARKYGIPVAMIDFKDHYSIFGVGDEIVRRDIFREFLKGKHFDLFFKKDLPLGYASEYVFPIAPVPVRPESYDFHQLPKDMSIFYSGKSHPKGVGDRFEVVNMVREHFSDAVLLEPTNPAARLTLRQYMDYLSRAKIALSPSGLVWDSFRHCEAGLAPQTALLAPRPYMEVTGPELKDGENAILYETELRDGKYHFANSDELVEKIKYYLEHTAEREKIAAAWSKDVVNGHTTLARARYIIQCIERAL